MLNIQFSFAWRLFIPSPLPWREIQLWFWSDNFLALHKFADRISSALHHSWTLPQEYSSSSDDGGTSFTPRC